MEQDAKTILSPTLYAYVSQRLGKSEVARIFAKSQLIPIEPQPSKEPVMCWIDELVTERDKSEGSRAVRRRRAREERKARRG